MPGILHIETSGKNCSVAVSEEGKILAHIRIEEERSHASDLTRSIDSLMNELKMSYADLNAVAVSEGPGSYTGLRIGVSAAKGICYGADIPLIAVPTLDIMLQHFHAEAKNCNLAISDKDLFVPMIDARRMEVYDCIYNSQDEIVREVNADIIDENSFSELLKDHKIFFFGDGSNKCQEVITQPNANFVSDILPDAQYMVSIAEKHFKENQFVDLAYYEPFYLKEFQATVPKNSVLKDLKKS